MKNKQAAQLRRISTKYIAAICKEQLWGVPYQYIINYIINNEHEKYEKTFTCYINDVPAAAVIFTAQFTIANNGIRPIITAITYKGIHNPLI